VHVHVHVHVNVEDPYRAKTLDFSDRRRANTPAVPAVSRRRDT